MNSIPLVDLKRQGKNLEKEIKQALDNTIQSANFILGPEIEKFEKDFAKFCGAKYCIALSSGTAALELALKASGIKPGDEVITAPHTFIANAESIISAGAKPVFADVDEYTFNIDPKKSGKRLPKEQG